MHRALIAGFKPDDGALPADSGARFAEIGEHISTTERRAATAERDAVDRFTAAYLYDRVGQVFRGTINGVTRFGLFVTLDETGADGLVPMSQLPDDYYDHDEAGHRLVGRRWGRSYHLGEAVTVRLMEAVPVTGGLILQPVEEKCGKDRTQSIRCGGRGLAPARQQKGPAPCRSASGQDGGNARSRRRAKAPPSAGGEPGSRAAKSSRRREYQANLWLTQLK